MSPEGNAQHGSEANGAGRALTGRAGRPMIASGYEEAGREGTNRRLPNGMKSVYVHPAIVTRAGVPLRSMDAPVTEIPCPLLWAGQRSCPLTSGGWMACTRVSSKETTEHDVARGGPLGGFKMNTRKPGAAGKRQLPTTTHRTLQEGPVRRPQLPPAFRKTNIVFLNRPSW